MRKYILFRFLLKLWNGWKKTKTALFNGITSPHGDYPNLSFFAIYNFLNDYFTPLINYSCNVETIEGASLILKAVKSLFEKGLLKIK